MSESDGRDLEARVARLERLVLELRSERESSVPPRRTQPGASRSASPERAASVGPSPGSGPDSSPDSAHVPGGARRRPDDPATTSLAEHSEQWLGRVGIGFVVLALAFLLKLSFDRGWITPPLRLATGFAAGVVLLVVGLRLEPARRRLAQVLMGGGIAVLYLVGFAGFQLYHLIPFPVALSLMTTTTVVAIVLSDRQDSAVLSLIGVSGGFATPFLLDTGSGNVGALSIYAAVVLLGGGAVQLHKGWVSLLGALLVEGVVVITAIALALHAAGVVLPVMVVVVYWSVCVASPLLRPAIPGMSPAGEDRDAMWVSRITVVGGTAASVLLTSAILDLDRSGAGALLLVLGLVTGLASHRLRGVRLSHWPSAEVSALCIAGGMVLVTWNASTPLLVMVEAVLLFVLVARGAPDSLVPLGHALAGAVAVAFVLYAQAADTGQFLGLREGATSRLGVLAMALVAPLWLKGEARMYQGAAYVGLLVWLLSELTPMRNGAALVSVAWSVQGATALVFSMGRGSRTLQVAGLATLGLVAAKLLLVDLSQVDPVLRILLFLGFGAALLGLGYWVNRPGASTATRPEG